MGDPSEWTMTSRRPMTRSFSGNGRTSSFSEDESNSNGRSESRNTYLSNVRPENRSTLCSVMAQLTEDIQPSFETTLKSKAVSENCNVKFTCVVSGYPPPELKWYKDDMEMDRYCGLPKYEIRKNGKTHTLHIYKCTLDDAAIYQVSASNSKGIVSCSGVLEVGTMNEFQIHQRFFSKLKEKAERKKKDLEVQAKKDDKENIQKPQHSPEPPPRKRSVPPKEEKSTVKELVAEVNPKVTAEANGFNSGFKDSSLEVLPSEELLSKKRIKMSNGVDSSINSNSSSSSASRKHSMGNGGENCYDGGMSLAQFLAETLQSQTAEEKQNSSRGDKTKEMETDAVSPETERDPEMMRGKREQEKTLQQEYEKEEKIQEELVIERENERERQIVAFHTTAHKHGSEGKHHNKCHKDHDHHNIQTSISSMFHSVKDFLFGKNKKDSHGSRHSLNESEDRVFDHSQTSVKSPEPEMPPSFQLQTEQKVEPSIQEAMPMEVDKPNKSSATMDIEQQSMPTEPPVFADEDNVPGTEAPPAHQLETETVKKSPRPNIMEANDTVEKMEMSVEPDGANANDETSSSGPQVSTEAKEKDVDVSVIREVSAHQEPQCLVDSTQRHQQIAKDEPSSEDHKSVLQQFPTKADEVCQPTFALPSLEDYRMPADIIISAYSPGATPTETVQEQGISVDTTEQKCEPENQKGLTFLQSHEGEKVEVKSHQQLSSDVNIFDITGLGPLINSPEGHVEQLETKTFVDQGVSPLSNAAVCRVNEDQLDKETKCASLLQETNVGFPTTAVHDSLEVDDLKLQPACISSVREEVTEYHKAVATQSSNSGFRDNEEKHKMEHTENSNVEKVLKSDLMESLKKEEKVIHNGKNIDVSGENLPLESDKERSVVKVEELVESQNVSLVNKCETDETVFEDSSDFVSQKSGGQYVAVTVNIPPIVISTVDDIPDLKPVEPVLNSNDIFIIPEPKITVPDLKNEEGTLPLTILAQTQLEPTESQQYDGTDLSERENQISTDFPILFSTQKDMENDNQLSLMESIKAVAQLDEQTEMLEQQNLPQLDFTSIPVINVSCTDDKEGNGLTNTNVAHTQPAEDTPWQPLFVVPPISITCHESDSELKLSTHREGIETETSIGTQDGTKITSDAAVTIKTEKTQSTGQDLKEMSENDLKENIPTLLNKGQTPKVNDKAPTFNKTSEEMPVISEILKHKSSTCLEDSQKNRFSVDRLTSKPPTYPSMSPSSLRKFMSKAAPDSENDASVPSGDRQSDKADEDLSGGSTPTSSLSCESSPRMKRRDSLTLIRSATPEELASGARRKIFLPRAKEDMETSIVGVLETKKENPYMSPNQARRAALLQASTGQHTPPMERRSPLLSRRKATLEVPKMTEEPQIDETTKKEEKTAEKKPDPLKAPQVIRKIRGEPFPDALGHLKLWCQFFNVLSDSTIKWYRDEEEILEIKRSRGDETQVALAIVLASNEDCGVYGCTINNDYGTDTTDFLLSTDILSEILLKDDLEVGEEIEMTPLLFTKGLADSGTWGDKYFGRILTETVQLGEGCTHKTSRVKVIYGLDPVFESGSTCIIKVRSPIAYGTKDESNLAERNQDITKQECKVQDMIREYCKIFGAEARVNENFGFSLEVIPRYLMYRPANSVPYATVEADLTDTFIKYAGMDPQGKLYTLNSTEVEQKCSTFQHWIHQWTHGNLLVTQLEGVEMRITNIGVVTKSAGYQGLTERGSPEVFEQFLTHHQCNYYCGLLGLRPLKSLDSLQQPSKIKGSRSPLLNRKLGSGSPQTHRKGQSPQASRKANSSPKVTKKVQETEDSQSKSEPAETPVIEMR